MTIIFILLYVFTYPIPHFALFSLKWHLIGESF